MIVNQYEAVSANGSDSRLPKIYICFIIYPKQPKIFINVVKYFFVFSALLANYIVLRAANPKVLRMAGFVLVLALLEGLNFFLSRVDMIAIRPTR